MCSTSGPLIESELFGREKGAYTGALAREVGRFELADHSTIFLDEIGELPPEVQSKLLRVLQDGEFERLGSSKTTKVDVRVIAATSRDLPTMVKEGKFRPDLFYRLNVFPIVVPPLRERLEDIPALVWYLLEEVGSRMGRKIEGVQAETMTEFQRYNWPGNVRELRNVIERNLILNTGPMFRAEIPELEEKPDRTVRRPDEVEYLQNVLQAAKWRIRGKGGAAEILGLKPTTLEARMKSSGFNGATRISNIVWGFSKTWCSRDLLFCLSSASSNVDLVSTTGFSGPIWINRPFWHPPCIKKVIRYRFFHSAASLLHRGNL